MVARVLRRDAGWARNRYRLPPATAPAGPALLGTGGEVRTSSDRAFGVGGSPGITPSYP